MKLTRAALLVLSMAGLYACGGGDGDTGQDSGITPPAAPSSVREALLKMDADGTAPKLNRDADVAGPDVDGNGVRDDLDAYINSLPDTSLLMVFGFFLASSFLRSSSAFWYSVSSVSHFTSS